MGRRLSVVMAGVALLLAGLPSVSHAGSAQVAALDNRFQPETIRIDPGDRVVWTNQGFSQHTVTSDENGQFDSGQFGPGDTFGHTFERKGYFEYFCELHGGRNGVGMAGVVIVGDADKPGGGGGGKDKRPKLVVPRDYKTIQRAVNRAEPGSTIVIRPGVYRESVGVQTSDLVIKGVDRFRTVLHGRDSRANGFLVDGVSDVTIANLTVRNFTSNGIFFNDVVGYMATRIDSIKNRTYGIYAFDSYDGVLSNSFGYGSGDSAFYVGQCLWCSALVEHVTAERNFIGYSGTNATGVVVRDSVFRNNGVGIVPNTLPTEDLGPNRGTMIVDNRVLDNNYDTIPEAGMSETLGIPFGTGVWLMGVENNGVRKNVIRDHDRYGVLVSSGVDDDSLPRNNRVVANAIRDSGRYDLAWDGTGERNCFSDNDFLGETGPSNLEGSYPCPNDLAGTPFPPVQADVAASLSGGESREQIEPPDPRRPRCQRGRRGCRR